MLKKIKIVAIKSPNSLTKNETNCLFVVLIDSFAIAQINNLPQFKLFGRNFPTLCMGKEYNKD